MLEKLRAFLASRTGARTPLDGLASLSVPGGATFAPSPGVVARFRPPLGPGVRVDTAVYEGAEIPPYYDSMIAKVIVSDDDRRTAIARMVRALEELVVEGIPTTRGLALDVLRSDGFVSGAYSTGYLDEMEAHLPSLRPA